jgi:membrane fusion protein (multidrug efflux system)
MSDDTGNRPVASPEPVLKLTAPTANPPVPAIAGRQAIVPEASEYTESARPAEIKPAPRQRRSIVLLLLLVGAIGFGAWKGYDWFVTGRFLVTTDDAYVKADMSVLAAKLSGYIASVAVIDNTKVRAGDELVRMDDGDYRLAVASARNKIATQDATIARFDEQAKAQDATIEQAQAQLASAKAESVRAAAAFDRSESLSKNDYATKATLDQARADRDRAIAGMHSAQASINSAEAGLSVLKAQKLEALNGRVELQTALEKAERDLGFTTIRAPFDGIVANKAVQPGQYVQPGTRLLAVVPLDSAYIEANYKETQLGDIKPGQKVDISVDAYSKRTIEGTVDSIAPASGAQFSLLPPENATGNFTKIVQRLPIRITVPADVAREGILRPGMSVVASVRTRDETEPPPTLLSFLGFDKVPLFNPNGTAKAGQ